MTEAHQLAIFIALLADYFGGRVDRLIMRTVDGVGLDTKPEAVPGS